MGATAGEEIGSGITFLSKTRKKKRAGKDSRPAIRLSLWLSNPTKESESYDPACRSR